LSDEAKKDLDECYETVEKLQEVKKELETENEQLREAADTFGDLAERLNTALKQREPADPTADARPQIEAPSPTQNGPASRKHP
jgi:cell division septum initiation protein DivIVA